MKRDKLRIYGQWAGNPNGTIENTNRCIEEVWNGPMGMRSNQCTRKRGHGPSGLYCKQHAKMRAKD